MPGPTSPPGGGAREARTGVREREISGCGGRGGRKRERREKETQQTVKGKEGEKQKEIKPRRGVRLRQRVREKRWTNRKGPTGTKCERRPLTPACVIRDREAGQLRAARSPRLLSQAAPRGLSAPLLCDPEYWHLSEPLSLPGRWDHRVARRAGIPCRQNEPVLASRGSGQPCRACPRAVAARRGPREKPPVLPFTRRQLLKTADPPPAGPLRGLAAKPAA